ncbi:MAG TPA: GNAT family N-acetyltransferase, partial [Pseudonocardiaceae bacterium]|nr:GNAT family N-acetyltransferase [Pseudonocardiaceae bacterium]
MTQPAIMPRPLDVQDAETVLEVINADRVPGQPTCTKAMLADAVAGRSPVDSAWWAELDRLAVDVACDGRGAIRGVVSYAHRARDGVGLILWLHGHEDPAVVAALVDHAIGQLSDATSVNAFEFASDLTMGLEGLPARHRPATRKTLLAKGFVETDLWRYMRRELPATDLVTEFHSDVTTRVRLDSEDSSWRIEVRGPDGTPLGDAQVALAAPGLGVLWWIG